MKIQIVIDMKEEDKKHVELIPTLKRSLILETHLNLDQIQTFVQDTPTGSRVVIIAEG